MSLLLLLRGAGEGPPPDPPDPPGPPVVLQRVATDIYAAVTTMHSERWPRGE